MAKDMHQEEWDSATLTKLDIFEQYVHKWLDVALNYKENHPFDVMEVYDLFCGTGFDGTKTHKGSPLRILDAVIKRNKKDKKVKLYFNDIQDYKIQELQKNINDHYPHLKNDKNIEIRYTTYDVSDYKILSTKYYRLILLDQYGIKHLERINDFLHNGTDILMFVSSGHIRRFCEDQSFQKYINIPKEIFDKKTFSETHRTITEHLRKLFPKAYISPFTLVKDNDNINGLIFFSKHIRGQEQFLKAVWEVDKIFGEGNCNIDKDLEKEKDTLFYNPESPSLKTLRFKEELRDYLKETRDNTEIRQFSYNCGFLITHTRKILQEMKSDLETTHHNGSTRGFHLKDKHKKVSMRLKDKK